MTSAIPSLLSHAHSEAWNAEVCWRDYIREPVMSVLSFHFSFYVHTQFGAWTRIKTKKIYLCFTDQNKAFNVVLHKVLLKIMTETGFPKHIIESFKKMHDNQRANSQS